VARLEHFGVKIMTDTVVGRTITVDELMDEQVRPAGPEPTTATLWPLLSGTAGAPP